MGCVYGSKCERRSLFSCLHFERISNFLFSTVFCDGRVMMANFSWRQRTHFLMFCCRQVLVLVSLRWLWKRCLCLLVAICARIRRYWMHSSSFWKKDYGCEFFVLGYPLLHRCNIWRNCLFLTWLCIWCFYTGIHLVGGMCFWTYNCIGWRSVV